jgi:cyclopropane-fatty-acyl-phospholipid synthase|tara:strand:- start:264 stop:1523 length:1260 start_codon:yes stop_codon:yes gene_type:complete
MQVDHLADAVKTPKKSTFLTSIFKSGLQKKFKNLKTGHISVNDGDETFTFGDSSSGESVSVDIHSQEFYVMTGSGGALGIAEAYVAGYWSSDDVVKLFQIILRNRDILLSLEKGFAKLVKPINKMIHRGRQNTLKGSKENILAHYDLSNDFYKLWLDPSMTYSCAFFNNDSVTLEEASIEKLDRICRKLDLSEDDSVLEIGTGWGSFSIHAAKNYGCKVTTTTISDAQFDYARSRIKDEGLESKITLINKDYRDLDGKYDKIVSIEMIEAVGYEYIPDYFSKLSSLLNNNGLVALQGITYNDQNFEVYKDSVDFIKKYIFPGSCLISIAQIIDVIKKDTDLAMVDMEDITKHYAVTLNRWRKNFMDVIPKVKEMGYSQAFINMWEFYFLYCEAGFSERNIGDVQMIFAKSGSRNINISY